jgi:hypothetical protein
VSRVIIVLVAALLLVRVPASAQTVRSSRTIEPTVRSSRTIESVEYVTDSMGRSDGQILRLLLGGSSWEATSRGARATGQVIIVIREGAKDEHNLPIATAYIGGEEFEVRHRQGAYSTSKGYLSTVIDAEDEGAVLKLADGSLWSVPEYDRYDTDWWTPPYRVLITANRMYLYNLKKGKRIWVSRLP